MMKQLSSYSVGASSVTRARSGSQDSRGNASQSLRSMSMTGAAPSSRSSSDRGQTDGGEERPGMLKQLSNSLLQSTQAIVRRNSFTGLASGDTGGGAGSSLHGLRNRNRGGSMLKQVSTRSAASAPGGPGPAPARGRQRSRRSFSFENFNLAHAEPSSERDILEYKIQERDDKVKDLEHEKREKDEELRELRKRSEAVKRQRLQDEHLRKLQVHRLKREHKAMIARVKVFKRDMNDKESLHGYAELIKGAAPTAVDSSYVMRLQSQLSKAIKKMEAMQSQMDLVQQTCEEVLVSLNDEIGDVIDEKCKVQVEMTEQVTNLKEERVAMEKKYEEELAKEEERYVKLKEKEERLNNPEASSQQDEQKSKEDDGPVEKEPPKKNIDEEIDDLKKEMERLANERQKSERALRSAIRKKKEEIARLQQLNELQGDSLRRLKQNLGGATSSK